MSLSQLQLFIIFLANGIFIGVIFDIFRVLRRTFKHKDFLIYIQDVVFWILSGIILLYSTFNFNDGELRLFMIIGALLGFFIYLFTLSKLFIMINVKIILFVKKIFFKPFIFFVINVKKFKKKKDFSKKSSIT